jgi:hypothetical protein
MAERHDEEAPPQIFVRQAVPGGEVAQVDRVGVDQRADVLPPCHEAEINGHAREGEPVGGGKAEES